MKNSFLIKTIVLLSLLLPIICGAAETGPQDLKNLELAIELSRQALENGDPPFAAVLVGPDGKVMMTQKNLTQKTHNFIDHAELLLAQKASNSYDRKFLQKCTLYSSMEPCAMCATVIYFAGIGRLVYGATQADIYEILDHQGFFPRINISAREVMTRTSQPAEVIGPLLREQARRLLQDTRTKMLKNRLPTAQ